MKIDSDTAQRIYRAYLAIFDMPLKDSLRREMLTWAFNENPGHWPVIGITPLALNRLAEHDFHCVSRIGIHRSHLVDRKLWQSEMLAKKMPFEDWLALYEESDLTVLATSSENMKGMKPEFIPISRELGLFRSTIYKWRHTAPERDFLRQLHAGQAG